MKLIWNIVMKYGDPKHFELSQTMKRNQPVFSFFFQKTICCQIVNGGPNINLLDSCIFSVQIVKFNLFKWIQRNKCSDIMWFNKYSNFFAILF